MKMNRITLSFLIASAVLFGVLAPVPRIAAEAPECAQQWVFSLTLEFSPGYWEAGTHNYEFLFLDSEGTVNYNIEFEATDEAPIYDGQVQLRFWALRYIEGVVEAINPAQDTIMQLTWLEAQERKDAEEWRETTWLQVRWDDGDWVDVPAGPLTKRCAIENYGYYLRTWGPTTID